jgi:sporulation protein YlmC with PRC-barrel domain
MEPQMRNLLITTSLVAPLLIGAAQAQQTDGDAQTGAETEAERTATQGDAGAGTQTGVDEDARTGAAADAQTGTEDEEAEGAAAAMDEMDENEEAGAIADGEAAQEDDATTAGTEMTAGDDEMSAAEREAELIRMEWVLDAEIISADGDDVGDVENVILAEDGGPRAAIVSVGGFLGIGDHEVAIPWEDLTLDEEAQEIRTRLTEEEIEALEEYEEGEDVDLRTQLETASAGAE